MNWIRKVLECAVLLGALICASSLEATTVSQSGSITPTHAACWTTTGVIQDCGTAAVPYLTTFGVLGGPLCLNSAVNTGAYNALCLSVATAGPAQISLQNYGGATAQQLQFVLNGTTATFATETGSFTAGNLACFQNTAGVLLDCGLSGVLGTMAYQNANAVAITGGTITGLTGLAIRDTSAAFDVTIGATSSSALTAGRALTIDMVNAARTLKLGANLTLATDPGGVTGALKSNGNGTFAQAACSDLSNGATGCSTIVGTIATQNANAVTITGGTLANMTSIGVGTATVTWPVTVAYAGSWPTTTNKYAMRVAINGFPVTDENGANALGLTQAIVGAVEIGASDTGEFNSGVSGYSRANAAASSAVGIYGQGAQGADAAGAWGANFVATNAPLAQYATNTGFNFGLLAAAEFNVNVVKKGGVAPTGNAAGVYIAGVSEIAPTGLFPAILIAQAGVSTNLPWNYALLSGNGASIAGIYLGAVVGASSVASQPLSFNSIDAGSVARSATLFADLNGILKAALPGGTLTFPSVTDTLVGKATTDELTNKTLTSSVGKGTWTASGTWTLPAVTFNGLISSTVTTGQVFSGITASSNVSYYIGLQTATASFTAGLDTDNLAYFYSGSTGFKIFTNGTEHFRFSSAGGLSIGTTTDPGIGSLQINANIFAPNLPTTTAALAAALCWTVTTGEFQRDTNASGCLVSAREAKNIQGPLAPKSALAIVMNMRPEIFHYKKGVGDNGKFEQIGFVADEMAMADERLAIRSDDGKWIGVRYMQTTAALAGAIQQLKADNDNLRYEITEIKRKVAR